MALEAQKELRRRGLNLGSGPAIERGDFEKPQSWFHPGQLEAWGSEAETLLLLCGRQSGKTVIGPPWMLREIARRGPGEYGIGGPNFPLLEKKVLPECRRFFAPYGRFYLTKPWRFEFSPEGMAMLFGPGIHPPTTIYFVSAQDPDSVASATYKAFWGDEFGQKAIPLGTHEELDSRLLVHGGRRLYTTIPYVWNWLKTEVFDVWHWAKLQNQECPIDVINFRTEDNPAVGNNPSLMARVERMRSRMPKWKAEAIYDGRYTRPAGLVYDCFSVTTPENPGGNTCKRFPIPWNWRRVHGVDFGPLHTAGIWLAQNPETEEWFLYSTYLPNQRITEEEHVEAWRTETRRGKVIKNGKQYSVDPFAVGGSWSEDEYRQKYAELGYAIVKPRFKEVNLGIAAVYGMFAEKRLWVFDDLTNMIGELETYSYEVDDDGNAIQEKIEDKEKFHRCDSLRYPATYIGDGDAAPIVYKHGKKEVAPDEQIDPDDPGPEISVRGLYHEGRSRPSRVGDAPSKARGGQVAREKRPTARRV